jgi:hypothetical protein
LNVESRKKGAAPARRCCHYGKNEAELQALQYGNEVRFIPSSF